MNSELTVIEPQKGLRATNWRELWAYRDLLMLLVWRDVKVRYAQTVLGFAWAVLRPVISVLIFSVIFGQLVGVDTGGVPYPLFSMAAVVPWTYFSASVGAATNSLVGNRLLSKVYFPRLLVPIAPTLSNLVDFVIALALIGVPLARYGIMPNAGVIMLPALVLMMMMTAAGLGMWLSSLAVQYRDVKLASSFLIQTLMYAAPVVWSAESIPDQYRWLYGLYPMVGVIEGFRAALIGVPDMPWDLLASGAVSTLVVFLSGVMYFRNKERAFADVA